MSDLNIGGLDNVEATPVVETPVEEVVSEETPVVAETVETVEAPVETTVEAVDPTTVEVTPAPEAPSEEVAPAEEVVA